MNDISSDDIFLLKQRLAEQEALIHALQEKLSNREREIDHLRKRAARTVLTGMCYSVGSATRQGSSSPTRFIGQSAMTSRT